MWDQLNLFSEAEHPLSVSEVTSRIRMVIEQEPMLRDLWIEGEVSNLSRPSSGHIYLTLKDAGSQLGAVIWRSQARGLDYLLKSGDQVQAHGRIGIYEQGGRYQFYIDQVRPAGQGSLYQAYERLKAQLQAEGLFDAGRKRPLPSFPMTIGVVTSPTAAALRDVLKVLGRRYPIARVLLSPTLVQGDAAPPQIVAALDRLNARNDVDVILLVRGGGSLEDLWAFNDERVARAVADSRLPVVSGVGHETDFSLADFAADRRAPTPSAAAEVATPNLADLRTRLSQAQAGLARGMDRQLTARRERLQVSRRELRHLSPMARIENGRQRVDDLTMRLDAALAHRMEMVRTRVLGLVDRLGALSPQAVLTRGYAIVRSRETGEIVTAAAQAGPGLPLTLQFRDGEVGAHVDEEVG
jgi:exodeoxyribonuclease VII large subunit